MAQPVRRDRRAAPRHQALSVSEAPEERLNVQVVVTPEMTRAAARAFIRHTRRRLALVFVIVFLVLLFLGLHDGDLWTAAITALLIVPFYFVASRRTGNRAAAKLYPVGQPVMTSFGRADVALFGPHVRLTLPYRDMQEPVANAGAVIIRRGNTSGRTWFVPVELCPPAALALIDVARREELEPTTPDPNLFARVLTVDRTTVDQLSAAVFWSMRRTYIGLVISLLPVFIALMLVLNDSVWSLLALGAVVPWNLYLFWSLRRNLRRQFPDGAQTAVRFTDASYVMHHNGANAEVLFADYDRTWVYEDAVVLRQRAQKQCFNALPRVLMDDRDVEHVRRSAGRGHR